MVGVLGERRGAASRHQDGGEAKAAKHDSVMISRMMFS